MSTFPRALLITALVGALVALVAGIVASGGASSTRAAATHALAARSLVDLAELAGLVGEQDELLRDEPMAVEVVSDGGPIWALDSVERAVGASDYFSVGDSPHLLRVEIIDDPRALALQLHLFRGGWELREAGPRRVRVSPWAPVLAGLLGVGVALYLRRPSAGLASAGVLAQLFVGLARPSPAHFPPRSLAQTWAEGPLLSRLIPLIRDMSPLQLAIAIAVLAGSLVLVGFDHSRSRGEDEDLGLGPASLVALLVTVGTIGWLEAASRSALFAACDLRFGAWLGWLALVGLLVAWLPVLRMGREGRR